MTSPRPCPPSSREGAIIDAALELLAEVGYDRLTMDAVAARAHCSKATIYRRWPGKAELVADALGSSVVDDRDPPDTGSLRRDLLAHLRWARDVLVGQDGDLLFAVAFAARTDPALAAVVNERLLSRPSALEVVLDQARARGEAVVTCITERVEDAWMALIILRLLRGLEAGDHWLATVVDDVLLPLLTR